MMDRSQLGLVQMLRGLSSGCMTYWGTRARKSKRLTPLPKLM